MTEPRISMTAQHQPYQYVPMTKADMDAKYGLDCNEYGWNRIELPRRIYNRLKWGAFFRGGIGFRRQPARWWHLARDKSDILGFESPDNWTAAECGLDQRRENGILAILCTSRDSRVRFSEYCRVGNIHPAPQ